MAADEIRIKVRAEVEKALKDLKKTEQGISKVKKKGKGFGGNVKAGALMAVAALGVLAVGIKKVVSAYAEQEKAEKTLAAAMQQAGTYTEEAYQHNLKYAASLQKITTYGDEAILGVQKMLTNFGVEGEMMDKLTKSTLDLAAAKGMSLSSAADLVAKTVGSSTNAMSRYGVEVTGAAGSTERMEQAVTNISALFGGAAAAEAQTFSGQVTQLKNIFGDLMETIGEGIVPILRPLITYFKEAALGVTEFIKGFGAAVDVGGKFRGAVLLVIAVFKRFVDLWVTQYSGYFASIKKAFVDISDVIGGKGNSFKVVVKAANIAMSTLGAGLAVMMGIVDINIKVYSGLIKTIIRVGKVAVAVAKQYGFAYEFIKKAAKGKVDFSILTDGAKEVTDAIAELGKGVGEDFMDVVKVFPETGKKIVDSYKKTLDDMEREKKKGGDLFSGGADAGELKKEADKVAQVEYDAKKDVLSRMKDLYSDFYSMISTMANQAMENDIAAINERRDAELALLDEETAVREEEELQKQIDNAIKAGDEKKVAELKQQQESIRIEEQKQARINAINERYDKEEAARKTRAARGQKAASVAQATISALAAYISTLAQQPGGIVTKTTSANVALGFGLAKAGIMAATPIPAFATGGTMITDGPQMFLAGDNPGGKERIDITPLDEAATTTGNTYNFYGIEDLSEARNELIRKEGASAWQ